MTDFGLDVAQARRDTPGCEQVLHFNNAGAALMPRQVLEAVIGYLQLEARAGGYEAAEQRQEEIEAVYDAISALINCRREEVAVVENATRAWDMAFYAIPFQAGDRILTTVSEYASNYIAFLQIAKRLGVNIQVIPNDEFGQVSLEALKGLIDERVKLIAVTHVPTNGGLVNPAGEIGQIARQANILYLLDACQSVGQMPIDVQALGCDMLSATGRKYLRGPRGTGFLYVRQSLIEELEPPFLDLHAATWTARDRYEMRPDARRFENWETNYAGKIGLGKAVNYARAYGLENIWRRVSDLASRLRNGLQEIPGVKLLDLGEVQCAIVSFMIEGIDPALVQSKLAEQKINVSASRMEYTLLDMEQRGLEKLVRASVHYYNNDEEIERFCKAVTQIARE